MLKGTVSVVSSNPSCKDDIAGLTMVDPWMLCLIIMNRYECKYNFENCLFPNVISHT